MLTHPVFLLLCEFQISREIQGNFDDFVKHVEGIILWIGVYHRILDTNNKEILPDFQLPKDSHYQTSSCN